MRLEGPTPKDQMDIADLKEDRNWRIRALWVVMEALSNKQKVEDFTNEDLRLWTAITEHSAIQDKLK
jgi:hypothetical protein